MGIDIRNGLQYECIACGACIDACDSVMDKTGYPRGLIRFTTQNSLEGKLTRILRPRIWVYGLILLALLIGWGVGVGSRSPLGVEVLRDRNALYRETAHGMIENGYGLKLINKTEEPATYRVSVTGNDAIHLDDAPVVVELPPQDVVSLPITLSAPLGAVQGRTTVNFVVESQGEGKPVRAREEAAFFGPRK